MIALNVVTDGGTNCYQASADDTRLTKQEIKDVEASLREIKEGKCKQFTNVEELLKELEE